MKIKYLLLVLCILGAVVFAQDKSAEKTKIKLGDPAPVITGLTWIKGGPVDIKRGSVYVVEFWATWCPPCRYSIPHLTEVQKKYTDKGVTIIGISNESVDTVSPFVNTMADKMDYTVAVDSKGVANKNYMQAFGERGIPTSFIIDKKGSVVWKGHPMGDLDDVLEQVVEDKFDLEKYLKKLAEAEERYKRLVQNYDSYFQILRLDGKEKASKFGAEIIKEGDTEMLNAFAWGILTKVEKDKRDLELARQAAAKANELAESKNPVILHTYALALYESALDQIQQAVKLQKKAVELSAGNQTMQQDMKKLLERYETAAKKLSE